MKKAAVLAAGVLLTGSMLSGCRKEEVEKLIEPLVADVQAEEDTQEQTQEMEEEEASPDIDVSIPIQEGARIAVVSKNTKGEFWDLVRKGMEDAVQDVNDAYGYKKDQQISMTFEGPDDERKVEEQINIIDAVIAENPDVLCLSVGDMDSCQAQLEAARENGIPVIVFDSNVSETRLVKAFRATDNVRVGEIAAYRLATAIGKMGKVAVFSVQEKTQSARDRTEGFVNYISNYTDIQVEKVLYADQVEDMKAAMQEVLEHYPVLDGVFCSNADIADMYLDMDKNPVDHAVVMVGVDATSRQIKAVQNGEELGVVSQDPHTMGYEAMTTAIKATAPKKAGVEIKKNVLLEPVWLNLQNIEDPAYRDYIYASE